MKENLFLVTLKNPPVTHLVDDYNDDQLAGIALSVFKQEGLLLIIPTDANCNIAYIKEITPDEAVKILKRIEERTSEKKIVQPDYLTAKKRRDS